MNFVPVFLSFIVFSSTGYSKSLLSCASINYGLYSSVFAHSDGMSVYVNANGTEVEEFYSFDFDLADVLDTQIIFPKNTCRGERLQLSCEAEMAEVRFRVRDASTRMAYNISEKIQEVNLKVVGEFLDVYRNEDELLMKAPLYNCR